MLLLTSKGDIMKITKADIVAASEKDIISPQQAQKLWVFLEQGRPTAARFSFTHILYYLGGMIAISAMSLFMTLGWEQFGGIGIFAISMAYAIFGLFLVKICQERDLHIPAGICATFVVVLAPLALYGLQQSLGFWPDNTHYRDYHRYIKWHWIYLELGTLVVAAIMLYRYRYTFLTMPVAVTLWYASMDFAAMIAGGGYEFYDFRYRALITMYFGIAMIAFAIFVDFKTKSREDYAFWLYLFAVLAFWGGMTSQESDNELSKLLYCCVNIGLITVGAALLRRVFVVFGALGVCVYLGHLSFSVFKDSFLFPIALSAIGFIIIYLGVLWQKNEGAISQSLRKYLPRGVQKVLQKRAEKID